MTKTVHRKFIHARAASPPIDKNAGTVLWITGLSGAGKSTIAKRVYEQLRSKHRNTIFLDGDLFRSLIGNDTGHDPAGRLENAYRIARFCEYFSAQGIHVVCATMSLFDEIQVWNREHISEYFEILIRVPLDELIRRDPRGLYARALRGQENNVCGIDLPYQEPKRPDMIIDNIAPYPPLDETAQRILKESRIFE